MKKIVAIVMAIMMYFSAMAIENPITPAGSLDELTQKTGCIFVHPPVMGVTDETFLVYNLNDGRVMGEYGFTVAGVYYTLRGAAIADMDISGVYIDGEPAFGDPTDGIEIKAAPGMLLARWMNIEGQYVLTAYGSMLPENDTFASVAKEISDITNPALSDEELDAIYTELEGEWQDLFSQRAMLECAKTEDGVKIRVSWANSAFEMVQWNMTAKIYEDGLLSYSDCECDVITEDNLTVRYEGGEGFFALVDGKLLWSGASDEGCTDCEFEKLAL